MLFLPISTITKSNNLPTSKKLANHSFINDGVVYTVYFGDQTQDSITQNGKQVSGLIDQQVKKHKPILILSDISQIGQINLGARKVGLELIRDLPYEKLAIVGVNFITQQLVKTVVIASGRGFKIQIFDNQKEAKKWLLK